METTTVTSEHRPLPTTLTDPTFLQGLEVILQPYYDQGASEDEIRDVVKRAEAFYLSSHAPDDVEQPQPLSSLTTVPSVSSPSASSSSQPPSSSSSDPPYPPTFAQLAALIATGAPIPGIKEIPDKLAEGEPSESRESVRRKPWEKEGEGAAAERDEGTMLEEGADETMAEEGSGQV
ncbi:hypothetical protein NBRC10513_007915 [Rhodotorula toruloides]|uniref:Peroxisomal membrane protein PEX14-like KPWE domain-containing protein n=1 Tax=Rhodotorula toruloides TaxID=5286 RepID=A0A0K3CCU1_RHOTO|nr:hypothetical protein AAT19DRAFT_13504 [Rhodotorula toruloides]